jgi:hypothetical protein
MLVPEAVLVEEAVIGEHGDITSESLRWNLMAATHQKRRLGHNFGIVRGQWNLLRYAWSDPIFTLLWPAQ